jgi:hypothetical protein
MTTMNTGTFPPNPAAGFPQASAPAVQPGVGQFQEPASRAQVPNPPLPNVPVTPQAPASNAISESLRAALAQAGVNADEIPDENTFAMEVARLVNGSRQPAPAAPVAPVAQPAPVATPAPVAPVPQPRYQPTTPQSTVADQALALLSQTDRNSVRYDEASRSYVPVTPAFEEVASRANYALQQAERVARAERMATEAYRENTLMNLPDSAALNPATGTYEITPAGQAYRERFDLLVGRGFSAEEATAFATEAYRLNLALQQRQAPPAPAPAPVAPQPTFTVANAFTAQAASGARMPVAQQPVQAPLAPTKTMDLSAMFDAASARARQEAGGIPAPGVR